MSQAQTQSYQEQELQKFFGITFLDIETVPDLSLGEELMELYAKRNNRAIEEEAKRSDRSIETVIGEHFTGNAGFSAEFGKIVSVSLGKWAAGAFHVKTYADDDEVRLLINMASGFNKVGNMRLCAHNGKEFDFPYLFRRMMINRLDVPSVLNLWGKKQWEYPYEDTMEMWGHTQWKYKVSLDLLCNLLGVPSSKVGDITGADVARVYYDQSVPIADRLKKIGVYNAADVVADARVYLKMKNINLQLSDSEIQYSWHENAPTLFDKD